MKKSEQPKTKFAYSNLSKNRGSMELKYSQHFTYLKVRYTATENLVDLLTVALGVKSIISLLISGIFWKRITALKNQNVLVVASRIHSHQITKLNDSNYAFNTLDSEKNKES